ncbi:hypothetical protein HFO17_32100 [Rhizobium laguerreae]|uniref:hypothetical protein n=1 Tax=Rhizobium laguerreae TaxID=1076926 RepID=UPI001C90C8AC|nr:hypothetical protein [Rhizobium laguerreae]MBY3226140.1 hypothetical protein [Rhizobium laguerreae]MBY3239118.1 hypothetical protein [Rhizobium laguerreae]
MSWAFQHITTSFQLFIQARLSMGWPGNFTQWRRGMKWKSTVGDTNLRANLVFAAFEFVDVSLPNGFADIGEIDSLNEVHLRNGCLDDAALKCLEPFDGNRAGFAGGSNC